MHTRQDAPSDVPSSRETKNFGSDPIQETASSQPRGFDLSDLDQKRIFWERHMEQCSQNSLTQKAYCKKHGLKIHQFYYWKRRLASSHDEISFLPVALSKDSSASYSPCAVRIVAPNGVAIELEGPVNLAELLTMAARL